MPINVSPMGKRATKFLFASLVAALFGATAAASDKHVVVVVWDGMRPDFVTEQNTPTLWKLAQTGVTFQNNRSVYPSATIVNGTAIVTGDYFLEDAVSTELHELGAQLRFKPLWLEDLVGLARNLLNVTH